MPSISDARIVILATHGFEKSELFEPLERLREKGATVHVASPETGAIRSWDKDDWGETVPVDKALTDISVEDYDALVLPGGQINPDLLRVEDKAVAFIADFFRSGKPLAAICHAPWLLAEAGATKGHQLTSYHSIRTDMVNAGADWRDEPVVVDNALITSRNPGDLDAFIGKIVEEVEEGRHQPRKLAA
ncbi:type 1 glutamine amidotransferase domain-containing protein [Roseitalea porphyridii]|uniref:Type 1 glutamine amidotransferase n=1 Tax=Roseitalea porphyridii TaxID=1852022 RepID=A0A4P6V1V6_9HYPH|nr:type 1 glutamine amidotransferase domain-containing protein [Roseitalea porphyridii]QBK31417.1 type 1 glutamine amidotransferase [Roseitalea porphyridii]